MKKEFKFGNLLVNPNVFMSPMHGVTDSPFRRLIQELSGNRCSLLVTEFVAMESLLRGGKIEKEQMRFLEEERPLGIQVFGADPELMEEGAKLVLQENPNFLELNAGCPAPKVVKRGGGSSLLVDLPRMRDIVRRLRGLTDLPFSVKVRLGWDEEDINVLKVLEMVQEEGADLFIIHGRTRMQGYKGTASWDWIQKAHEISDIPIVGNGDIKQVSDVERRLKETGVDGVSVGRGVMHNPWLFGQVADFYETGQWSAPSLEEQTKVYHRFGQLQLDYGHSELRAIGKLKQFTARMTKCFPHWKGMRQTLLRAETLADFLKLVDDHSQKIEQEFGGSPFVPEEVQNLNGGKENAIVSGRDFKK